MSFFKVIALTFCFLNSPSLGAEMRHDLNDIFSSYYVIRKGVDFTLDYNVGNGRASYTLHNVYEADFLLEMIEELTIYDTQPNDEIEMCNGTVTNLFTKEQGVTYGTIDKMTEIFEGQFILDDVTYYVESADKYLKLNQLENGDIVSILYRSTDVISKEGVFEPAEIPQAPDADDEVNFNDGDDNSLEDDHVRFKPSEQRFVNRGNNICSLDIRIDNGVYNDMGRNRNRIRNTVYQQVMTLNRIYGSTFRTGNNPTVNFVIGRIAIATNNFCRNRRTNIHCTTRRVSGSSNFLDVFSRQDASEYCLSYMFTNRDFGSTLGVAYVSGVCNARPSRSFNTGFVVINRRTAQFRNDLTFTHEVGHNFGANHDQTGSCLGTPSGGPFLMSPTLSRVERPNNDNFSTCSQRDIINVLNRIFTGRQRNCFTTERARLIQSDALIDQNSAHSKDKLTFMSVVFMFIMSKLL